MTVALIHDPAPTLEDIAAEANAEHHAVVNALVSGIQHGIRCGELLNDAYVIVGQQNWDAWVKGNLCFTPQHAGGYKRLAHYKDQLPREIFEPFTDANGRTRQPSIARALLYIKGLPPIIDNIGQHRRLDPGLRAEAKRLRANGLSYPKIADVLNISGCSAYRLCNPQWVRKEQARARAARKEARGALLHLRRERDQVKRDTAAKEHGGPLGETYSLLRRALDAADKARPETAEAKRHLADAVAHLHRAEDDLSRAIRRNVTT